MVTSRRATDAEVETWRRDGWVLLDGLVGTDEIDALTEDLRGLFPDAADLAADPEAVTEQWLGRPVKAKEVFVWPDEGPGFRPDQQRWSASFPFPGTGALNRICVHPSIVDFAERALDNTDIRLYQAHASAKYAGVTNYEQPMHIDRNHSWLPPGSESPWWNLEGFLYLTDVTEDDNPTRLVSVGETDHVDSPYGLVMPNKDPGVYAGRAAGGGRQGFVPGLSLGLLASRCAVRFGHGGPDRAGHRVQERAVSSGSGTTPSNLARRDWSGPSLPKARRRGNWSSSAGRLRVTRCGRSTCSIRRRSVTRVWTSAHGERRSAALGGDVPGCNVAGCRGNRRTRGRETAGFLLAQGWAPVVW